MISSKTKLSILASALLLVASSSLVAAATENIHHLKPGEKLENVLLQDRLTVVKIFATWCPPCQRYAKEKIIEQLAKAYPDVLFVEVDTDKHKTLVRKLKVRSIPYLLAYKDGERITGKGTTINGFKSVSYLSDWIDGLLKK